MKWRGSKMPKVISSHVGTDEIGNDYDIDEIFGQVS
jgi:hypothetical protein